MTTLAIVGGTGLSQLHGLENTRTQGRNTRYGETSAVLTHGVYADREIVFLPRHGHPHVIPPHKVNYRANIEALREIGVNGIIGINAVGGITPDMSPCRIVVPDQIIDYTWGRQHTFFDGAGDTDAMTYIDFTRPYSEALRRLIITAAEENNLPLHAGGTYGATQGPRLETAAEVKRLQQDGCDIVGMTGMPEAALAREAGLDYASISLVVNWAAGIADEEISMDSIKVNLERGMESIRELLQAVIGRL